MILQVIFYLFSSILVISSIMVTCARNPVHSVLYLILAFFNAAGLFILLNAELLAMLLVIVYVGAVAVLFLFVVMMMNVTAADNHTTRPPSSIVKSARLFLKLLASVFTFFSITTAFMIWISPKTEQILTALHVHQGECACGNNTIFLISAVIGWMLTWIIFRKGFKISLWSTGYALLKSLSPGGILGIIVLAEMSYVLAYHRPLFLNTLLPLYLPNISNTKAIGQILYTDYVFLFETAGMILLTAIIGAIVLTHRKREGTRRQDVRTQMARRPEETLSLHDLPVGKGLE